MNERHGYAGDLLTKSFDCIRTTLLVRGDWRLLIKDHEVEQVPLAELPAPDDPKKHFVGMFRVSSETWRHLNFLADATKTNWAGCVSRRSCVPPFSARHRPQGR